jgi:hypothetical protein
MSIEDLDRRIVALPDGALHQVRCSRAREGDLREGLEIHEYPDFGLYVLRSQRLHVVFRCGGRWLGHFAGHAHDDQLSVEVFVDGRRHIRDPGTYLYTPLPHRRDAYRCAAAHWSPATAVASEARLDLGLFDARIGAVARTIALSSTAVAGEVTGPRGTVVRMVRVCEDAVEIVDALLAGEEKLRPPSSVARLPYSPGYGLLLTDDPGPSA